MRRFQSLIFMLVLAVLAGFRTTPAASDLPVTQYTLPNGLTVILAPMPAAQRVAVVTGYAVGSADEPRGRSGFAHLFEHLMFEGTRTFPDFDAETSALGAETNAFTEWDQTTYYAVGQPRNLPRLLRLEADRMANLANAVTQQDLDNQRDIVKNEMRQNTIDQPGAAARLQAMSVLAGTDHPYGHAPIGSIGDLDAATLADVQAFHRVYYVPANAMVAITGKFDVSVARDLVARTFGMVPGYAAPAKVDGETTLKSNARLEFRDAVEMPIVMRMINGPRDNTREELVATLLNLILASDNGPLYAKLVHRDGLATSAAAGWDSRRLGGTFMFYASAASGTGAAKLEAGLDSALAEILEEGLNKDQMEAAIASVSAYLDSATSDPLSYALMLQGTAASTGSAADWKTYLAELSTITPAEALAELRRLVTGPAVTTMVLPGPRNAELPPVITQSTGTADPLKAPVRDEVTIPELGELMAEATRFPEPVSFTLDNGMRVNVYGSADTKTTAMALIFPRGTTATNGQRKGLTELAIDVRSRGAGAMTMAELSLALDKIGGRVAGDATDHATVFTASAPTRNFDGLTQLFATVMMYPRFDAKEWKTQVDQRAQSIEQRLKDPATIANRAVAKAVFPKGAAEGEVMDAKQVRSFAMADAAEVFATLLHPDEARLEVVTSLPPDEVRKAIVASLGLWRNTRSRLDPPPPQFPLFGNQGIVEQVDGATQSAIVMTFAAPEPFTPEAIANDLAMQVLGGGSSGRLYRALREDKGWSYGIYGGTSVGEKGGRNAMGYISTSVQADRTGDSVAEIRRVLEVVKTIPVTDAELHGALQDIRNEFAAILETADGLLGTIAWSVASGFELADVERKLALYESATLNEVQAQAEAVAGRPMITVIAGDRARMK